MSQQQQQQITLDEFIHVTRAFLLEKHSSVENGTWDASSAQDAVRNMLLVATDIREEVLDPIFADETLDQVTSVVLFYVFCRMRVVLSDSSGFHAFLAALGEYYAETQYSLAKLLNNRMLNEFRDRVTIRDYPFMESFYRRLCECMVDDTQPFLFAFVSGENRMEDAFVTLRWLCVVRADGPRTVFGDSAWGPLLQRRQEKDKRSIVQRLIQGSTFDMPNSAVSEEGFNAMEMFIPTFEHARMFFEREFGSSFLENKKDENENENDKKDNLRVALFIVASLYLIRRSHDHSANNIEQTQQETFYYIEVVLFAMQNAWKGLDKPSRKVARRAIPNNVKHEVQAFFSVEVFGTSRLKRLVRGILFAKSACVMS